MKVNGMLIRLLNGLNCTVRRLLVVLIMILLRITSEVMVSWFNCL